MFQTSELLFFAGAALLMVLTPGPNMVYLVSRSICQGRWAGVVSLLGIVTAFTVHMLSAAIGLSALLLVLPLAYEMLKWAGAAYLLFLAWQMVRPGARSAFEPRQTGPESATRLFVMGFLTSLLNPKIAFFYLAILPQFVVPSRGHVIVQSLGLGMVQIVISFLVNLLITLVASDLARWFRHNPRWLGLQRYVMGSVLAGLAVRLAFEQRRSV